MALHIEDQDRQRLARSVRLIGGSAQRLRIIELLNGESLNVKALAVALGLSQPAVSHHLKFLRDAKIVDYSAGRRRQHHYFVRSSAIVEATLREARIRLLEKY